jgi:hypothetical protein
MSVRVGVEVKLSSPDDFLKVKETLTRIGVASKKEKTLWQTCHILHKQGRYFIVHFKEMLQLDGVLVDFDESDVARRNTIANLLDQWNLVTLVDKKASETPVAPIREIKILPFKEKDEWSLVPKYTMGKKRAAFVLSSNRWLG